MNKKIISLIILVGLFCLASIALGQLKDPLNGTTFPQLLGKIATKVGTLIASLGTIMIIVAGILYLTSAGSTTQMAKAKTALIYAIAGIVIGTGASAIVAIATSFMK